MNYYNLRCEKFMVKHCKYILKFVCIICALVRFRYCKIRIFWNKALVRVRAYCYSLLSYEFRVDNWHKSLRNHNLF